MNFISLFAGIGGFDLGLERAGMKCIGQVEIDPFCQRVLAYHWPNVKRISDIKEVKGGEFGTADLICGGYPCQCDSTAGKRRGKEDDRWLWPEMFRIIKIERPSWVIGENVINHESMGLRMVISDLEGIGYQVRPFIIPNASCRLQTVERHIWVIAKKPGVRLQGNIEKEISWKQTISSEFEGSSTRERNRWNLSENRLCGISERVPDWMDRIKSLGNAVCPQVVEVIGRAIIIAYKYDK